MGSHPAIVRDRPAPASRPPQPVSGHPREVRSGADSSGDQGALVEVSLVTLAFTVSRSHQTSGWVPG
jgi:hypothetical protein